MMAGEKPGGHGERCVAVGTLDMALWDAAAKIADLPLYQLLAERLKSTALLNKRVQVYAGGGYHYPSDELSRLSDEIVRFMDLGFRKAKIKIGARALSDDLARIEAASRLLRGGENLAVDAMNAYDPVGSSRAAHAMSSYGLWWFEDICDPLDFETLASVAAGYGRPLAAGEALFSPSEAALLDRYAGLRRDRDILVFDPVHCYGLPGYLAIVRLLQDRGWPSSSFWPHGGHLFCLHLVAALGLGGAESNPLAFLPFGGLPNDLMVSEGIVSPPEMSGIGFERKDDLWKLMRTLQ
jgi:L-alanine-DL-glutamate epimerase-like enolase superfamily enzyme